MNASLNDLAPNKCVTNIDTAYQLFEAHDADLHAHNLTNWQQQYDQISAGKFYGSITELGFEGLQVFKEHTSQAVRQSCVIPSDSIWLGFSLDAHQSVRIDGKNVLADEVMCKVAGQHFELVTPEEFDIYGLVVNKSLLERSANLQDLDIARTGQFNCDQLKLSRQMGGNIRSLMKHLLNSPCVHNTPQLGRDLVMMLILEVLENACVDNASSVTYKRRKAVVDTVKEYVYQNCQQAISVLQLCEVANVSRRTLQYSFDSILGISPIQFLRITRLNGVRRALCSGQSGTISDVASQWGFWHLSQFSQDYKNLFGELPSQTVSRKG